MKSSELTPIERERQKKYNNKSDFFRNDLFSFVVIRNISRIVTVEIAAKDKLIFNKRGSYQLLKTLKEKAKAYNNNKKFTLGVSTNPDYGLKNINRTHVSHIEALKYFELSSTDIRKMNKMDFLLHVKDYMFENQNDSQANYYKEQILNKFYDYRL